MKKFKELRMTLEGFARSEFDANQNLASRETYNLVHPKTGKVVRPGLSKDAALGLKQHHPKCKDLVIKRA